MIATLAAVALLAGVVAGERRRERREAAVRSAFGEPATAAAGPRSVLMVGAGAMLGIALLGAANPLPVPGLVDDSAPRSTVVLALDVSRSMTVPDAAPDRLTAALMSAIRLTAASPTDRIGLVTFSGEARLLVPPTADRALVTTYLEALDPDMGSAQGSDLSNAIAVGLEALGGREFLPDGGASSIVVLSDGEGFEEAERRDEATAAASSLGVPVHWVTVGGERGGLVPGAGADAISRAAPSVGAAIAQATGGIAVDLSRGEGLAAINRAVAGQRAVAPPPPPPSTGRGIPVALLAVLAFALLSGELLLAQRVRS